MSECVVSCIFGEKFKTVYPSVQDYDSYFFSNNMEIEETVEGKGWKFIFIDFPLSDDDAVCSMQSKYVKYLIFLKNEQFNYFCNYDKIVYTDHKHEIKNEHIKFLIKKMGYKNIIIRDHPGNRKNIWEEVADAMFQDRYLRYMPMTIDYIREKIAEGYSDRPIVVWTSLMVYAHLESATIEFTDKVYDDMQKIGTSECQIIWSMIGQRYKEIIEIIKWNEMEIKWGEPKEGDESTENENYSSSISHNGTDDERFLMRELHNKTAHIEQLLTSERYLSGQLNNKEAHVEQLILSERRINSELQRLKGELKNKKLHIQQLILSERRLTAEINDILSSRAWKLATKISAISRKLFPQYSKRRLFAKLVITFIRHPLKIIVKMTPGRIWKFFHVLGRDGTTGVSRLLNRHLSFNKVPEYSKRFDTAGIGKSFEKITDYRQLIFKNEEEPTVSIIIPVFNNFDYTYNCLESILDHSGDLVNYEIIVADDNSNDFTMDIEKIALNIKVIKNKENIRFVKNCNNASKYAKGKYILFLNNDTQVQENWLFPLVELIEKDDSIGAVGSMMVYEDGTLQEAGGIYWNDASAWNYGRMDDPALPEYNYVKEVDYISGASLMIKKSIWDELGGFDESFTPAYCEDADICFSIRKKGYKVLYQPASVVMHFEGVSNGNDITEGQKQYQVINGKKFYEKWKNILENENFPNGEHVFHARDRSGNKKTILMIDHYVPHFDKDAGSRAVFQLLELFVKLGFNVKFIGDNFFKHEPYTGILLQMGIEVLYGNYYAQNWKTWLRANGQYIDYAILSRPHIAVNYIDEIKEKTKAKIFYYGHDLHFLRESREYEITKDKEKILVSQKMKKMELSLMKKSDVVYYFSTLEADIIKEMDSSINCKVIPINIFPVKNFRDFNYERKDLLFVGGFAHSPNIDSIIWFIGNIFPSVRKAIPGIILYVIGSNVTDEIKKLGDQDIRILGYVEDSVLEDYYKKCRICVAPLRFGAGIKGKVLEAMYNQIPIITTTIGAEGLPGIEKCLVIEDNAGQYAKKLIDMYDNDKLLKDLEKEGFDYIMKNFTFESAKNILLEDFDIGDNI